MTPAIIDSEHEQVHPEEEDLLDELTTEVRLLRKGHAQELFQARLDATVGQLAAAAAPRDRPPASAGPSSAQVRVLLELDQAVLQLLRLAEGDTAADPAEDTPRSLREG